MITIKYLLIVLLFTIAANTYAQDTLLQEDVNADTTRPEIGPNLKHYTHSFIGLGIVVGADSLGSEINYGRSWDFSFGYRYKARINNFYAVGADLLYHVSSFSIRQDTNKILPNDSLHNKEKLKFHNLALGLYNRFNYGKRGNYIGNYIDVGVQFEWPFYVVHFTKDEYPVATRNNGGVVKTKTSALLFVKPYYYSAFLRIGFNRYIFTAAYRLTDLFVNDSEVYKQYNRGINKYPELPPLIIGAQIGMFQ